MRSRQLRFTKHSHCALLSIGENRTLLARVGGNEGEKSSVRAHFEETLILKEPLGRPL